MSDQAVRHRGRWRAVSGRGLLRRGRSRRRDRGDIGHHCVGRRVIREAFASIDADARRTSEQIARAVSELATAQRW